ncbi:CheC domain protein [Shewanella woodyi ATCC 51908]|uniref:CheC domain protein n=1 Tax=Shewanella woodyi (strain ATCC 51908 / MS32) TaxID=392500 RepID=B1KHY2_SHEWM|nr:CheC domain protein [Shewanella woodyi ATCC 51908]
MNVNFINPFLESLINVISTMANMQLTPGKPGLKQGNLAKGDVSGLIGMVGPQTKGSLSITFELNLVLEIMQNMLGENPGMMNEEITDLVGEITNMVTGGAKNKLGDKGYEFDMATPIVVSGIGHTISHKANGKKIIMPFTSPHGAAYIEICFEDVNKTPEATSTDAEPNEAENDEAKSESDNKAATNEDTNSKDNTDEEAAPKS